MAWPTIGLSFEEVLVMNIGSSPRKLYVIGNGFDLHHGLPCGYADFKAWLQGNRPDVCHHLNRLYGDCDENNWCETCSWSLKDFKSFFADSLQ